MGRYFGPRSVMLYEFEDVSSQVLCTICEGLLKVHMDWDDANDYIALITEDVYESQLWDATLYAYEALLTRFMDEDEMIVKVREVLSQAKV